MSALLTPETLARVRANNMKNPFCLISILFFALNAQAEKSAFDAKLLKKVDTCAPQAANAPTVYLVKQWHLPPQANTKTPSKGVTTLPQAVNQEQIYQQLIAWVESAQIDTMIAEGCEGEITPQFKEVFQGWSYSDLEARAKDADYAKILAHAVVKAEVKSTDKVSSFCGDSLSEIKRSQAALSDARAAVGYFSRLSEHRDHPEKLKPYLEGVREVYSLPKDASVTVALKAVANDLKKSLDQFQKSTHERDLAFVRKINQVKSNKPIALVIGGLHAQDLKAIFGEKKINCLIFEPLAYQNDEEAMRETLKNSLSHF